MTRPIAHAPLVLQGGNIAGVANSERLDESVTSHRPHVGILTEGYHWTGEIDGYRIVRATDGLSARRAKALGAEAHDVILAVRDDVELVKVRVKKMTRPWWGPFTRRRREARRYLVLVIRVDGVRWPVLAVHFEPGGPSGGRKVGGRNKGAWRDSASVTKAWLRKRRRAVAIGDFNANGADLRRLVAPKGAHVVMASSVDGVIVKGARTTLRKLHAPKGMHGWFTATLTPTSKESR